MTVALIIVGEAILGAYIGFKLARLVLRLRWERSHPGMDYEAWHKSQK